MKDTAPISSKNIKIAALIGVVAAVLALFALNYSFFASLIIGILLAIIAAIALMYFGPEAEVSQPSVSPSAASQSKPEPVAKISAATAATVATATAVPVAVTAEPDAVPAPAKKPAAKKAPGAKAKASAKTKSAAKPKTPAKPKTAAKAKTAPKAAAAPKEVSAPKAAPKAAAKSKVAKTPVAADGKPVFLQAARASGADDLKQIKGVGPKMEASLNKMGVYHFDQVSGWRKAEVTWVDENLEGVKGRVSRDEWVKQAKILAKGGTTAFSKKVSKGGVY